MYQICQENYVRYESAKEGTKIILHNVLMIKLSWEPICPRGKRENRPGSTNSETGSEGPLQGD